MIGRRTVLSFGVLFLAACEGDFLSYEAETPAERELRESREALQSTVGQGSLVGAAGGAAIGVLLGGGLGGARGAQIGQLVGAGAGNYVRQLQEEFATEEEVLGQVISDIQATNARLERTIAAMQAVLAEQRAQVAADSTRVERNASEAVAAVEAAEVQERFFGQTRSLLIETGAPVTSSAYDGELGRLQSRIAAMRDIASDLADL
ncbi:MAG: hypothetical protein AAGA32_05310 [Pseudomonadota bacterium]